MKLIFGPTAEVHTLTGLRRAIIKHTLIREGELQNYDEVVNFIIERMPLEPEDKTLFQIRSGSAAGQDPVYQARAWLRRLGVVRKLSVVE